MSFHLSTISFPHPFICMYLKFYLKFHYILIDIDFYFKTYSEIIISIGLRYFISLGLFR